MRQNWKGSALVDWNQNPLNCKCRRDSKLTKSVDQIIDQLDQNTWDIADNANNLDKIDNFVLLNPDATVTQYDVLMGNWGNGVYNVTIGDVPEYAHVGFQIDALSSAPDWTVSSKLRCDWLRAALS